MSSISTTALPTAGAIPVLNEKGERTMQKVKVQRYVSGRRPRYADETSSESSDEETTYKGSRTNEAENNSNIPQTQDLEIEIEEVDDPRLRRLKLREILGTDKKDNKDKHRPIHEPEVIHIGETEDVEERLRRRRSRREVDEESSEEKEEPEDESVERRHAILKSRKNDEIDEELLDKEEDSESEEEESEYEEYTDSEDDTGPRLKPVFVPKRDRVTVENKDQERLKELKAEEEQRQRAQERKQQALKMLEEIRKKEEAEKIEADEEEAIRKGIAAINTDDENEETAYEIWKLRELKRVKRDKEEREAMEREKQEIERLRNMTEEQRQEELKKNPKIVTNQMPKGKYNFLQKYYHRGAFYLDEDDDVLKRDFAQPTLEDHFDKTVLPKVMQVKNFGRSGRTKYTHLVDQDTTAFDSPWATESAQTSKFHSSQAGGMKPVFERPSGKRK